MKILIISSLGYNKIINSEVRPVIGDKVDLFYKPAPEVTGVLLYPSEKTLKDLNSDTPLDIDLIVTLD